MSCKHALVWWSTEATEPVTGGIIGFLTDLVIDAAAPDELIAWAEQIGHPAAARALT